LHFHADDAYYWALLEPVSPELCQSVCHYSIQFLLDNEVPGTDFHLREIVCLDDDTDVALGHAVLLGSFGCGVIGITRFQVGTEDFIQMFLGIIGLAIFSLGGNMATVGLGTQGFLGRGIECLCLIRCQPFCQGFYLGSRSEECIHVFSAIVVLACNLAHGYLVILGRSVEPRTLHFVDCHNILARDVFKWF